MFEIMQTCLSAAIKRVVSSSVNNSLDATSISSQNPRLSASEFVSRTCTFSEGAGFLAADGLDSIIRCEYREREEIKSNKIKHGEQNANYFISGSAIVLKTDNL